MNCKDCCQDCQRIGCDIELECSGYVEPSNGIKERMDERLAMMYRLYTESEEKHIFAPSEPITNADRIRSMRDIELAEWLTAFVCSNVAPYATARGMAKKGRLLEWLKQESEGK